MDTPIPRGEVRQWTVEKAITPLKFCHWLAEQVEKWRRAAFPRIISGPTEVTHYELSPYLESLQGTAPHVVTVWRSTILVSYMIRQRPARSPHREVQYPADKALVLSVAISPIKGGSRLVVETAAKRGINLEKFVMALDELPDVETTAELERLEFSDTTQAANDNWTPATDIVFLGTMELWRDAGFHRILALGINCQRINNPPGITIFQHSTEVVYGMPALDLYHIVAEPIPPEWKTCYLKFLLAPRSPDMATDISQFKPQIEFILEDLRSVGWIKTGDAPPKDTEQTKHEQKQEAPGRGQMVEDSLSVNTPAKAKDDAGTGGTAPKERKPRHFSDRIRRNATLADYLFNIGLRQGVACGLANIDVKDYKEVVAANKLYSKEEYQRMFKTELYADALALYSAQ